MSDYQLTLLLGAGFSKEIFPKFPTMQELTKSVLEDTEVKSLLRAIDIPLPLFGQKAKRDVNIEDWIQILEESGVYFKNTLTYERRKLVVKVILDRISKIIQSISSDLEFTPAQLDLFEELIKSKVNILTTNYDLIFERAIYELMVRNRIDLKTPYDLNVGRIELAYKRKRETYLSAGYSDVSQFSRIYKLHGSCDWFSPGIDESEEVFVDISLLRDYLGSDLQLLSREICESMTPLFAGPSSIKSQQINSKAIKPIWASAYSALRGTSKLFVYGSSLHKSDATLNSLVIEGLPTGVGSIIFDPKAAEIRERLDFLTTQENNYAQPLEKVSFEDLVKSISIYS